jgi:hypothetical protein
MLNPFFFKWFSNPLPPLIIYFENLFPFFIRSSSHEITPPYIYTFFYGYQHSTDDPNFTLPPLKICKPENYGHLSIHFQWNSQILGQWNAPTSSFMISTPRLKNFLPKFTAYYCISHLIHLIFKSSSMEYTHQQIHFSFPPPPPPKKFFEIWLHIIHSSCTFYSYSNIPQPNPPNNGFMTSIPKIFLAKLTAYYLLQIFLCYITFIIFIDVYILLCSITNNSVFFTVYATDR